MNIVGYSVAYIAIGVCLAGFLIKYGDYVVRESPGIVVLFCMLLWPLGLFALAIHWLGQFVKWVVS